MSLFTKLYLYCWRSYKYVGPNKEVRIRRTYQRCGYGILDIIWYITDNRKDRPRDKRIESVTINKRCRDANAISLIKRVEKVELIKELEEFQHKVLGADS